MNRRARIATVATLSAALVANQCEPIVGGTLVVDPAAPGAPISRALLGQYDLSGALFRYDEVPGLRDAMTGAGFEGADWRLGLGRWEVATQLLPTLSDGSPCPLPDPAAAAPPGASDLDLIAARDWFVDDGSAVTLADTLDDTRYALGPVRDAIDVASTFGATPFLSVDLMPRALAANRSPLRTDCLITFANRVSNVRPADPLVFGAAVRGMVERLVLGHGGAAGRPLRYVELWNEPELPMFWDPDFEDGAGPLDRFFPAMINALVQLDALRDESPGTPLSDLRIGLASFASARTAAEMIRGFDDAVLPTGAPPPLDFVSFHAYRNDPLEVVDAIRTVADAAAASTNYAEVELVLAEWGANLEATGGDVAYARSMAPALHAATVLVEGAALGLDRAHHAIFYDFYDVITFGLVDHEVQPKPLYHAYALLAEAISGQGERLEIAGAPLGRLSPDTSALATREADGTVHWIVVHRSAAPLDLGLLVEGRGSTPDEGWLFSDPRSAPVRIAPAATQLLPPESIAWLRFAPRS